MNIFSSKYYCLIAGLVLALVGIYIAITPAAYMTAMDPDVTMPSVNILSDLRGMGGSLLLLGIYVAISAFRIEWQSFALAAATAVYISFVVFRTLSFLFDGLPDISVFIAFILEVCFGVWGVILVNGKNVVSHIES